LEADDFQRVAFGNFRCPIQNVGEDAVAAEELRFVERTQLQVLNHRNIELLVFDGDVALEVVLVHENLNFSEAEFPGVGKRKGDALSLSLIHIPSPRDS